MADRYWVGGTANWDGTAGTKWALTSGGAGGESVPTSADDVFFTNLSTGTCTIATGNTGAKSITCTGFTGTLAGTAAISVSGNVTLVAGMTVTYTGTLSLIATSTLISAGKTLGSVTVNGSGITVTLGDALNCSDTLTVTQGTFTTANFNLTCDIFSSSNTNTRTITLGSSTITLSFITGLNGLWLTSITTNLTFNANTSEIIQIGATTFSGSVFRFQGGGLTFYNYSHTTASAGSVGISGANTYNNFTFRMGSAAAGAKRVFFGDNITVNGTFDVAGVATNLRTLVCSDVIGTSRTVTAAAVSATDADFRDITIAGAAAPISPTRAGDCKGNSGITFPAAKTVYWNLAGTQNWSATGWATTETGTPDTTNFPLAQDTAVFTNSGAAGTVSINSNYSIGTLDMSGRTSAMTLNNSSTQTGLYGDWVTGSGVTLGGSTAILLFAGRVTQSVTSAGKTFTFPWNVSSPSGTVLLVDNCTLSNTVTQAQGTLDLSGKTLSVTSYITAAGTKNLTFNGGTVAVSNATTTAWNNAQPTGYTTTAGTGTGKISMTAATGKTFVGGGSTYNCTLSNDGAGALTITGSNTFTTLANGVQPTTFTFTAGTTTTLTNWNISGTAGNLVTIGSATAASHTLSKSSGTVSADYLSVSRSTATGGASWYAGANSTNGGNNSGWIFAAAPLSSANFLMFF